MMSIQKDGYLKIFKKIENLPINPFAPADFRWFSLFLAFLEIVSESAHFGEGVQEVVHGSRSS